MKVLPFEHPRTEESVCTLRVIMVRTVTSRLPAYMKVFASLNKQNVLTTRHTTIRIVLNKRCSLSLKQKESRSNEIRQCPGRNSAANGANCAIGIRVPSLLDGYRNRYQMFPYYPSVMPPKRLHSSKKFADQAGLKILLSTRQAFKVLRGFCTPVSWHE